MPGSCLQNLTRMISSFLITVFLMNFPARIQAQISPDETVKQFKHAENLEVKLWAAEPMLNNPTTMDIDSRGRIWITEGLNYRLFRSKNFKRVPNADAIKILEDTDHDGKADKVTVFADNLFPVPMGIAVEEIRNLKGEQTGTRVYVGNAPNLLVLEDTDGDDKADNKIELLTGFGALDSDHGLHGMVLAMDGKLYFTHGDGKHGEPEQYKNKKDPDLVFDIMDRSGRRIVHKDRGSAMRMNPDGTNLEILGVRFRNNYEICVDSFGRVFVSDNDDDGNRGSRMAWVMKGGNYGYQIPGSDHHWAEDLPGHIPKTAGTGNGSPAGILVYEGDLFGEEVKGAVLQIDARTRQINLHPLSRVGAGIRTEYKVLLTGEDDWYRPIDASVGPDGAIYIADWYDAGVGGNRFVDQTTGRIYRLAPKGTSFSFQPARFDTIDHLIEAIQSPVAATRFAARQLLVQRQAESFPAVKKLCETGPTELQCVALQILSSMGEQGKEVILDSQTYHKPEVRELGLQLLARDLITNRFSTKHEEVKVDQKLLSKLLPAIHDPDAGVRRELLLALVDIPTNLIREELLQLVLDWDGQDRYYLEAILLATKHRKDEFKHEILEKATAKAIKDPQQLQLDLALPPYFPTATNDGFLRPGDKYPTGNPASVLIGLSWGLEWAGALPNLEKLLDQTESPAVLKGVEIAVSRFPSQEAGEFFVNQFFKTDDILKKKEILSIIGDKFKNSDQSVYQNPMVSKLFAESLKNPELQSDIFRVMGKMHITEYADLLMVFANNVSQPDEVRASAINTLGILKHQPVSDLVKKIIQETRETNKVTSLVRAAIRAQANLNPKQSNQLMQKILKDPEYGLAIKREALRVLASSLEGANLLIQLGQGNQVPKELYTELVSLTHNHPDRNIRRNARSSIPLPPSANGKPLPPVAELISQSGNPREGEKIFFRKNSSGKKSPECSSCHRVQGVGESIGPDLSTIGVKFGKKEMLESILNPNGAISYNYQTEMFMMEDGRVLYGLVESESPEEIVIKTAQKERITLDPSEIEEKQPANISIMPEGLERLTTEKELVDLLAYLSTLRKPSVTVTRYQYLSKARMNNDGTTPWKSISTDKSGKLDLGKIPVLTAVNAKKPSQAKGQLLEFGIESPIEQKVKFVFKTTSRFSIGQPVISKGSSVPPPSKVVFDSHRRLSPDTTTEEWILKKGKNSFKIQILPPSEGKSITCSVVSDVPVRILEN